MLDYFLITLTVVFIFGIYTLSLNLQWGESGVANLGPIAFMAIGGYTMVILNLNGINPFVSIMSGIIASGTAGGLIASLGSRLNNEYFSLLTLGFAHTFYLLTKNNNGLTGGSSGLYGFTRPFESLFSAANYELLFFVFCFVCLSITYFLLNYLKQTAWGKALNAIRDDEKASKALGKNVRRLKIESVVLGSMMSGLAGILLALNRQFISPNTFGFELTLYGWLSMILGGSGDNLGSIFGTFFVFGVLFSGTRLIA